jgi:hypothetical protein
MHPSVRPSHQYKFLSLNRRMVIAPLLLLWQPAHILHVQQDLCTSLHTRQFYRYRHKLLRRFVGAHPAAANKLCSSEQPMCQCFMLRLPLAPVSSCLSNFPANQYPCQRTDHGSGNALPIIHTSCRAARCAPNSCPETEAQKASISGVSVRQVAATCGQPPSVCLCRGFAASVSP